MKNFVQKSFSFDLVAPKNLSSGVPFVVGNFVVIPVCDAVQGQLVTVFAEGIFSLPVTGQTNIGDALYLHTDGTLNTIKQDGAFFGFSIEASTGGIAKVMLSKAVLK